MINATRSVGNYFEKTQDFCFLGRLLRRERKTFHSLIKNRPIVQENFILVLADEGKLSFSVNVSMPYLPALKLAEGCIPTHSSLT